MPEQSRPLLTSADIPTDLGSIIQHDFGVLVEQYRYELHIHCYRMLGSLQDAEDVVQETFLKAWRRRETYQGRSTVRAWLYRIATNLCLDTLAARPRRMLPITREDASTVDVPIPASVMEPIWLEPIPDELIGPDEVEPEYHLSVRENISVAFMAALHLLPPRQRAVLILRDVLEWHASEVAELLGVTVSAVKSALRRARVTLDAHSARWGSESLTAQALDQISESQLKQYVHAWESADIAGLLALLKDDATFSMPPIPSWYQGRDMIGKLVSMTIFRGEATGRWRLLPTRANGQVAFGLYQRTGDGQAYNAYGIQLVRAVNGVIEDITTFRDASLFSFFKLPAVLPV